ncbi:hypothetical protein BD408DRAFT_11965 [Parasitella parasitica]|nr:hypothetical protein BD408DRAFT_11965 [Parasitella parasitica]
MNFSNGKAILVNTVEAYGWTKSPRIVCFVYLLNPSQPLQRIGITRKPVESSFMNQVLNLIE